MITKTFSSDFQRLWPRKPFARFALRIDFSTKNDCVCVPSLLFQVFQQKFCYSASSKQLSIFSLGMWIIIARGRREGKAFSRSLSLIGNDWSTHIAFSPLCSMHALLGDVNLCGCWRGSSFSILVAFISGDWCSTRLLRWQQRHSDRYIHLLLAPH